MFKCRKNISRCVRPRRNHAIPSYCKELRRPPRPRGIDCDCPHKYLPSGQINNTWRPLPEPIFRVQAVISKEKRELLYMLFSQRQGLTPASKLAQIESIDDELRNGLWSMIRVFIFEKADGWTDTRKSNLSGLFIAYWHSFFKQPIDTLPHYVEEAIMSVRTFFFEAEWYIVYDFIEFTASNCDEDYKDPFIRGCNRILERDNAAYRFVNVFITQITSSDEVSAIEEALTETERLSGVRAHLSSALQLLSDRQNPDFRNSIKESISAVEAICKLLAKDDKATLGQALSVLEKKKALHGALKKSFSTLYGYTSDADGIRHSMLEESEISLVDAKFFLVTCSAFINYLIGKASDYEIDLKQS